MRQHGVDVRVARIFNTYGPRMRLDDGRVVSNLIGQALRGAAMTIYGDGSQTRSFCYAGDTVDGLMRLMRREGRLNTPVNIGSQDEIPVIEIARRVAALTGRDTGIVHLPLPVDDPQRRRPELGLADGLLDWRPTTPLDAGLRRTIAYFRAELRRTDGASASAIASGASAAAVPAHASTLHGEPGRA
jgi:UDP-glucuronate decarboxylase